MRRARPVPQDDREQGTTRLGVAVSGCNRNGIHGTESGFGAPPGPSDWAAPGPRDLALDRHWGGSARPRGARHCRDRGADGLLVADPGRAAGRYRTPAGPALPAARRRDRGRGHRPVQSTVDLPVSRRLPPGAGHSRLRAAPAHRAPGPGPRGHPPLPVGGWIHARDRGAQHVDLQHGDGDHPAAHRGQRPGGTGGTPPVRARPAGRQGHAPLPRTLARGRLRGLHWRHGHLDRYPAQPDPGRLSQRPLRDRSLHAGLVAHRPTPGGPAPAGRLALSHPYRVSAGAPEGSGGGRSAAWGTAGARSHGLARVDRAPGVRPDRPGVGPAAPDRRLERPAHRRCGHRHGGRPCALRHPGGKGSLRDGLGGRAGTPLGHPYPVRRGPQPGRLDRA